MISFRCIPKEIACFLIILCLTSNINASFRLEVVTHDYFGNPIPQVVETIQKISTASNPLTVTDDEFCLYIRYLYDFVLAQKRYKIGMRIDQIKSETINQKEDPFSKIGSFFLKTSNDALSVVSGGYISEPLFQKSCLIFLFNMDYWNSADIFSKFSNLLNKTFILSEFAPSPEKARSEPGSCMNIYEMMHFTFLIGKNNAGLNLWQMEGQTGLEMTRQSTNITIGLLTMLNERDDFIEGIEYFINVLSQSLGAESTEFLKSIDNFVGESDGKKTMKRNNAVCQILINYARIFENMKQLNTVYKENSHVKQFIIKGTILALSSGLTGYLTSGVEVEISSSVVVNQVGQFLTEQCISQGVSQTVSSLKLNEIGATDHDKQSGAVDRNLFLNLFDSIASENEEPIYDAINQSFKDILPSTDNRRRDNLARSMRLLI